MILIGLPERLCIYFIYDKDGIIDDYIIDQIKDMRENVSFLHCVINGALTDEGREKLEEIADEVFERENEGNDIGAYKAALEHIGWDKIGKYDELVLMNNTCFGPVYPFKEAFDWSKNEDVDLWGLSRDTKSDWLRTNKYLHYNKTKTHIQSFFLVMRKPLVGSEFLKSFFREIPYDVNYIMSGMVFEYAFPGYFEEYGYKGAVYCDEKEDLNYPLLHDPANFLRKYRMPLFKKRSFFHHYTDVMTNTGGEATYELIRFIQSETDYDMSMVWKPILRTCSLSDIVRCAQLNRVLSSNTVEQKNEITSTVGIVFHAFYEDLFDESLKYLENFPENAGFLITTDTAEKKELLQIKLDNININAEIVIVNNRGRDVSALLVGAANFVKKYDLICFAHDKKTTQIMPEGVGRSWRYKLYQNTFGTKEYVENVIRTFEKEKQLGIAFPSPPNHYQYAYNIGNGWVGNFNNTDKLLSDFGVKVRRNEHTLCVSPLGTCFWFRPRALEKLFEGYGGEGWHYEDFPCEPNRWDQTLLHAIERAYAYFAQDAGYYPAYLYNSEFAAIELTNLEFFKIGSGDMRAWVERLAMEGIGQKSVSSGDSVHMYDQKINYGIKQSLLHLAYAIRCKYPKFWRILLPFRRFGQKVLRIKTK